MQVSIGEFAKTAAGISLIERQGLFCIDGQVWQGWRKTAIPVEESQLTDDELETVEDVDETMVRVRFKRAQRLQSRHARKQKEYDDRRHALRQQRSAIIQAIKEQKDMGMEASPDDLAQIEEIDARMAGLVTKARQERAEAVVLEREAAAITPVVCEVCGKTPPDGHPNPTNWLRGHNMKGHVKG